MMQADRVRDAALIVLRSHGPNLARDFAGDPFEDREPGRLDTIVIGYENAI